MREEGKRKNRAAMALTLCFCVMALTSLFAVKASLDKIKDAADMTNTTQSVEDGGENTEAAARTPVVDSQDGSSATQTKEYIAPLSGSIQLQYSMDSLVYSKTLDQYMTHPGVDISAALSTKVKAVADGTVSKVYNDDRYGVTVQITHKNGLISTYSNLADQGHAEIGDEVTQGQTIGCVGDSALFESLEETHLHFGMLKDGEPVDPGEYISELRASK